MPHGNWDATGWRPWCRPRMHWRGICASVSLGMHAPPEEPRDVASEREVWASLLRLLPPVTWTQINGAKWVLLLRYLIHLIMRKYMEGKRDLLWPEKEALSIVERSFDNVIFPSLLLRCTSMWESCWNQNLQATIICKSYHLGSHKSL